MSTATEAPSLVTQMIVAQKYGVRLTVDDLAAEFKRAKSTVYNEISAGTFPVPTYVDGNKRYAHYSDVAAYLDSCAAKARAV